MFLLTRPKIDNGFARAHMSQLVPGRWCKNCQSFYLYQLAAPGVTLYCAFSWVTLHPCPSRQLWDFSSKYFLTQYDMLGE